MGRERSIIKSLGFMTDEKRLNVAITRPKHFLFMIGNRRTLSNNNTWKELIDQCELNGGLYTISEEYQKFIGAQYDIKDTIEKKR